MKAQFNNHSNYYCYLFIVLIQFLSFNTISQNSENKSVYFSYDLNGNRIHRWIEILKMSEADSSDSLFQDSLFKKKTIDIDKSKHSISIFPNPTKGLLELKITGMQEGEFAEFIFVTLTGQEMIRRKTYSPGTLIDIGHFAPGTYIVTVHVGTRIERWKIIKQQ